MKIVITLSQLEVTGAEVYAVTLANKLVENGHEVFIISDTLSIKTKAVYLPVPFNKRKFQNRIKQIILLARFLKKNKINIIHSNSRASGWISYYAALIAGIPKVSTVHGKQHVHLSSRIFRIFGDLVLPVCESIKEQLVKSFKFNPDRIKIVRNGIEFKETPLKSETNKTKKTISLIGRLSGPKGEIACDVLNVISEKFKDCNINVIGGRTTPEYLKRFQGENIKFVGFVDNLNEWIDSSDVVIGSGRVAIEAITRKVNTIAVGEWINAGLVTNENLQLCLESNFGDIAAVKQFDWDKLEKDIRIALNGRNVDIELINKIKDQYDTSRFYNEIENSYQSLLVNFYKKEIPVIMYHRLINDLSEAGKHGIYVTVKQFTSHMDCLKNKGYTPITFQKLDKIDRFDKSKKYIIITFDDGYEDNYTLMFPILKRFGFKAVIFYVTHSDSNIWDTKNSNEPKVKLMNKEQVAEMSDYGIEFGAHAKTHPDLLTLPIEEAVSEITESKKTLENIIGKKVESFAYPYGSLNNDIKNIVKDAGFKYGIATDNDPLALHEDYYQIRRIGIFPNTDYLGFIRKTKGNYAFKRVEREKAKQRKIK
jgi:peptidoglycan/xylan/chitin deacetylase (PgdA/CDA1 family)/UDP-N-acetylglucosamine:LPS N-acetylglucosamine transferase